MDRPKKKSVLVDDPSVGHYKNLLKKIDDLRFKLNLSLLNYKDLSARVDKLSYFVTAASGTTNLKTPVLLMPKKQRDQGENAASKVYGKWRQIVEVMAIGSYRFIDNYSNLINFRNAIASAGFRPKQEQTDGGWNVWKLAKNKEHKTG